MMTMVGTKGIM